jgi:hypothetical protein
MEAYIRKSSPFILVIIVIVFMMIYSTDRNNNRALGIAVSVEGLAEPSLSKQLTEEAIVTAVAGTLARGAYRVGYNQGYVRGVVDGAVLTAAGYYAYVTFDYSTKLLDLPPSFHLLAEGHIEHAIR